MWFTPLVLTSVFPPTNFLFIPRVGDDRLLRVGVYLTERAPLELASDALLDRRERCNATGIREGGDRCGGDCTARELGRGCRCRVNVVVALPWERCCWGDVKVVAGSCGSLAGDASSSA